MPGLTFIIGVFLLVNLHQPGHGLPVGALVSWMVGVEVQVVSFLCPLTMIAALSVTASVALFTASGALIAARESLVEVSSLLVAVHFLDRVHSFYLVLVHVLQ